MILCPDTDLNNVSSELEKTFGESSSARLIWKPKTVNKVDRETCERLLKLIDALEDDDDVQTVTANFEVNEL